MSLDLNVLSSLEDLTDRGSEFQNLGPAAEKALLPVSVVDKVLQSSTKHACLIIAYIRRLLNSLGAYIVAEEQRRKNTVIVYILICQSIKLKLRKMNWVFPKYLINVFSDVLHYIKFIQIQNKYYV